MKKIICSIVLLLFAVLFALRFHYINSNQSYPIHQNYKMTDDVPLENDFFVSANENMDGYSIKVVSTELLTYDEFMERYHVEAEKEEAFETADHILLVTADFSNISNNQGENAGINLHHYILQSRSYINYVDREAFAYVNDFNVLSFCLREKSEKRIVIPFRIYKGHISMERFYSGHPELVVSLYPYKKGIELY